MTASTSVEADVIDPITRRALLRRLAPEGEDPRGGPFWRADGSWRRITGHHARQLHFSSVSDRTVSLLANGADGEVRGRLHVFEGRKLTFVPDHLPCPIGPVVVRYRLEGGAYTFLSHVGAVDGNGRQPLEAPLLVERRDYRRSTRFEADGVGLTVELGLGDLLVDASVTEASASGLGLEGLDAPEDLRPGRRLFGWLLVHGQRYVRLDVDLRWLVADEGSGRWAAGFRVYLRGEDAKAYGELLRVLERRAWHG